MKKHKTHGNISSRNWIPEKSYGYAVIQVKNREDKLLNKRDARSNRITNALPVALHEAIINKLITTRGVKTRKKKY